MPAHTHKQRPRPIRRRSSRSSLFPGPPSSWLCFLGLCPIVPCCLSPLPDYPTFARPFFELRLWPCFSTGFGPLIGQATFFSLFEPVPFQCAEFFAKSDFSFQLRIFSFRFRRLLRLSFPGLLNSVVPCPALLSVRSLYKCVVASPPDLAVVPRSLFPRKYNIDVTGRRSFFVTLKILITQHYRTNDGLCPSSPFFPVFEHARVLGYFFLS